MIYAKQVSPEYQESPLFMFEWDYNDIVVCGNRDYNEHTTPIFDTVYRVLESGDLLEEIDNISTGWYKNITEAIVDFLPPEKGKYSTLDIHKLKGLVSDYASCNRQMKDEILCKVLSIVTGKKWACSVIRGCCQSDWNYIYYVEDEWSEKAIECFESEYFNTGTEWIIHDEKEAPESPEDISGYSMYCYSWNDEGIREEIAKESGVNPAEVVMWAFDGYKRIPEYREVS